MLKTLALPYVFAPRRFESLLNGKKPAFPLPPPVTLCQKESCFIWTKPLYLCQVHFCCGFQTMCASCVYK